MSSQQSHLSLIACNKTLVVQSGLNNCSSSAKWKRDIIFTSLILQWQHQPPNLTIINIISAPPGCYVEQLQTQKVGVESLPQICGDAMITVDSRSPFKLQNGPNVPHSSNCIHLLVFTVFSEQILG